MILTGESSGDAASQVALVSGRFDPLHPGHIEYFRAATGLGLPLMCCVASDADVRRKHPPLLSQQERGLVIGALEMIDYVHLAQTNTEACIRAVRPRFFAKGSDWRGRLPAQEVAACRELGVEIVFLDTLSRSSSEILRRYLDSVQHETEPVALGKHAHSGERRS
jgi:cytidyltransferase-like protein